MNKNLKVTTKSKDINVVIGNLRNSNSTKQNDFTKVNETLTVVNDKITITNNTRSKHEGDEEYTDVKERTRINEEEENKNISNNKLENVSETSKESFNKQLLEQRKGTSGLNVKLKTEIDSGTKIKILFKETQDEVTRLHESEIMSKGVEGEKERKISCLQKDIIGS